jgi:hypothetical protein
MQQSSFTKATFNTQTDKAQWIIGTNFFQRQQDLMQLLKG